MKMDSCDHIEFNTTTWYLKSYFYYNNIELSPETWEVLRQCLHRKLKVVLKANPELCIFKIKYKNKIYIADVLWSELKKLIDSFVEKEFIDI